MSIASEISRISAAKSDILTAIAGKGVSTAGATHIEDCPALINSITTGGGGGGTALCNTGVSGMYSAEITALFTATQKAGGVWTDLPITGADSQDQVWVSAGTWADISGITAFMKRSQSWFSRTGPYTVSAATAYQSYWPVMQKSVVWNYNANSASGTGTNEWQQSSQFSPLNSTTPMYLVFPNPERIQISAASIEQTGGSLPYPLRPTSERGTAVFSASSYKWATTSNILQQSYADSNGTTDSTTTYSVNSADIGRTTAQLTASLAASMGGNYPKTAYTYTFDASGTGSTGGSGWR